MLRCRGSFRSFLSSWSTSLPCFWVMGSVAGAFLAARSERCRVTLFRPTRMWVLRSGGGGGAVSSSWRSFLVDFAPCVTSSGNAGFLLRFLPLEGWMWVLRWWPMGSSRLD